MGIGIPNLILERLEPGVLDDGVVRLKLQAFAQHSIHFVPTYHFRILDSRSGDAAWKINLRLGWNENLLYFAGHVGFAVNEGYRGRGFAARSLEMLKPLAARHGYRELWITCNPENFASRRSCERAGAMYVNTVDVPEGTRLHEKGIRQKCRYRLVVNAAGNAGAGFENAL